MSGRGPLFSIPTFDDPMTFRSAPSSFLPTARVRLGLLVLLPAFVLAGGFWLTACQSSGNGEEGPSKRISTLFEPLPEEAPNLGDGPVAEARIDLGHKLYFEPKLSRSGNISCNTCHVVGAAGVDHRKVSKGVGDREGRRNSPTVYNAAFLESQFWDGRAATLEEQAKGPLQAHVEMDMTPELVVKRLRSLGYTSLFKEAYPKADTAVTFNHVADAIAAFERTLITPGAPFDRYLEGEEDALTAKQKKGLETFTNSGCAGCHRGPMLGGQGYANFSHAQRRSDTGREEVTGEEEDRYSFRIASLRNVAETPPYFHDGSAKTLREAVSVMGEAQLGRTFNEQEIDRLVAFLRSLTGEFPNVPYPKLPRDPSAMSGAVPQGR